MSFESKSVMTPPANSNAARNHPRTTGTTGRPRSFNFWRYPLSSFKPP